MFPLIDVPSKNLSFGAESLPSFPLQNQMVEDADAAVTINKINGGSWAELLRGGLSQYFKRQNVALSYSTTDLLIYDDVSS